MVVYKKLDNYFFVSADRQTFLGFEMTANLRDTSPLISLFRLSLKVINCFSSLYFIFSYYVVAFQGFNVAVTIDGLTIFKKHISGE